MRYIAKILLFFLILGLNSCNIYRKIPPDKRLLHKNIVIEDGKKVKSEDFDALLLQRPNTKIFGYPYLADLYMLADQQPDYTYYKWIKEHPRAYHLLVNLFSRKQIVQLQNYYKDINKTIMNSGEKPVFIDTSQIKLSNHRLHFYYVSNSYLDAQNSYQIDTLTPHKVNVAYKVHKNKPYFIRKYKQNIHSKYLQYLYDENKNKSFIGVNKKYKRDDFVNEKERLTNLFRNRGVYHFQPSYVNFDLVYDTINKKRDIEAYLNIPKRTVTQDDTVYTEPFLPYKIKNINIYIDTSKKFDLSKKRDSIKHNQTTIYSLNDKLRYKPKLLTESIFIKKGNLYSDTDRLRTHRLLMNLENFKQAYILYSENKRDTSLTANIYLISKKRFSTKGSVDFTHSNIYDFGIKGSSSFSIQNLFKGGEVLNTSIYLMTAASKNLTNPDEKLFDVSELGTDVTLRFPRLLLPFGLNKYIPKYMLPSTYVTFLANTQNNIGLDRSKYAGIFGFKWRPIKERKFKIDLVNFEYITNKKAENYFKIYTISYENLSRIINDLGMTVTPETADLLLNSLLQDSNFCISNPSACSELRNIQERKKRITQNIFILSNKFDFFYDSRNQPLQRDFYLFKSSFELSGTLLGLFATTMDMPRNDLGQYTLNGIPYAEYFRFDLSFIRHWKLHKDHILAYRAFVGYAIPYGNSLSVPFVSSYFAGGSNDIRGWRAYSLGPGTSGGPNEFNEANFKLMSNLEYRFPLTGYFKGALFTDVGNIWHINNNTSDTKGNFKGFSSLKDIAIATGLGLRVDFTYFIIRFDLAFKTYDPSFPMSERWINLKQTSLNDGVLNIGISYPF